MQHMLLAQALHFEFFKLQSLLTGESVCVCSENHHQG